MGRSGDEFFVSEYPERCNAHLVTLATFGEIAHGSTRQFDPEGQVPRRMLAGLRLCVSPRPTVLPPDSAEFPDCRAGRIRFLGCGGWADRRLTASRIRAGGRVLVRFALMENDLRHVLNRRAPIARRALASLASGGRIVSAVWIPMEQSVATMLCARVSRGPLDQVTAAGASLDVPLGAGSPSSLRLSPGTTFAYELSRVAEWNGNRVAALRPDRMATLVTPSVVPASAA